MKKENRFSQVAGVLNANALRNVLLTDIFYKFYQNIWNTSCVSQNKRNKQTAHYLLKDLMKEEKRFSQVADVLNANALRNVLLTYFYKFYQNMWTLSCAS